MLDYLMILYYGFKDFKKLLGRTKSLFRGKAGKHLQQSLDNIIELIQEECYERANCELVTALKLYPHEARFWTLKARVYDLMGNAPDSMLYAGMAISRSRNKKEMLNAKEVLTQAYSLFLMENRRFSTLEQLIQIQKFNLAEAGHTVMGLANVVVSLWEGAMIDPLTSNSLAGELQKEMEGEARLYFEKLLTQMALDKQMPSTQYYAKELLSHLRKVENGLTDRRYWLSAARELERWAQSAADGRPMNTVGVRMAWAKSSFGLILICLMLSAAPKANAAHQKAGIGSISVVDLG